MEKHKKYVNNSKKHEEFILKIISYFEEIDQTNDQAKLALRLNYNFFELSYGLPYGQLDKDCFDHCQKVIADYILKGKLNSYLNPFFLEVSEHLIEIVLDENMENFEQIFSNNDRIECLINWLQAQYKLQSFLAMNSDDFLDKIIILYGLMDNGIDDETRIKTERFLKEFRVIATYLNEVVTK